jgi:hypothetical protein
MGEMAAESTPDADSGGKAGLRTGIREGYSKLNNKGRTDLLGKR